MKKRIQESLKRLQAEGKVVTITKPLVFRGKLRIEEIFLSSQIIVIGNNNGYKKKFHVGKNAKLESRSGKSLSLVDFKPGDIVKLLYNKTEVIKIILEKKVKEGIYCHINNIGLGSRDSRICELVLVSCGEALTVNRDVLKEWLSKKGIQHEEKGGQVLMCNFSRAGKPLTIDDFYKIEKELLGIVEEMPFPRVLFVTNRLEMPKHLSGKD